MIAITEMIAPIRNGGPRSGIKRTGLVGITVHNTGNYSNGAGALNHGSYLQSTGTQISWHYCVDDKAIVQSIPEDEVSWQAGDGRGDGNYKTISIEICVNPESNILTATNNAVDLVVDICKRHDLNETQVFQHNHWSGKNCPAEIRKGNPYSWEVFISKVKEGLNPKPVAPPVIPTFKIGDVVNFKGGKHYSSASALLPSALFLKAGPAKITNVYPKGKHQFHLVHTDKQTSVYGWVDADGFTAIAPTPTPAPTPVPTPVAPTAIKVGDKVKINQGAKTYTNGSIATWVYTKVYTVDELKGDRAVLDKAGFCTAFNVKNLTLVSAAAPAPVPSKPTLKDNITIAREVIAGKWGNGADRVKRLTAAGYDAKAIQIEVNKLFK